MCRGFGQRNGVAYMGAEHFALECFLYQFRNALVQVLSSVVLGYQNPGYRKIRVQTLLHLVDDLHKFGHSTHCQELRLNRDNQPIRGRQCVKREQRQRGGTVDQDIIEFLLLAYDKVGLDTLPSGLVD